MPDMVVADLRWDAAEFVRVGSNPFGSKSAATCAKLSRQNVRVFLAEVLVVALTECGADRLRSEVRWSCDGQLSDQWEKTRLQGLGIDVSFDALNCEHY